MSDQEPGSLLSFVYNRRHHVAVTWNDVTIIWGGWVPGGLSDSNTIYCHRDGKWFPKTTGGDVPIAIRGACAAVIEDTLYVMCGQGSDGVLKSDIYAMDLNSTPWNWTKLTPTGNPPFKCADLSSWVQKGKFYGFGGYIREDDVHFDLDAYPDYMLATHGYINQMFCYNTTTNGWEWPSISGDIPSPRAGHTTIVSGDQAILFGGKGDHDMNDLYSLNLEDMTWKQVHPSVREMGIPIPECRGVHNMTLISPEAAVLFGGNLTAECWILNTAKLISGEFDTPSSLWKHCSHHENKRFGHAAVVEPISKRLWILGGYGGTGILSMSFNSAAPLRLLATRYGRPPKSQENSGQNSRTGEPT